MVRATRDACRQTAQSGLLVALALGCATIQEPPGGPPDFTPPAILSISPDSGAIVDGFSDDAVIRFDEVISERSGGGLENLIRLSPRAEEVSVSWKRSRMTIKPRGGWKPSVVYHLTLLPGVTDLQNNRSDSTRTIIFSTGGPIPETRIDGTVIDWDEGRAAPGALIEAVLLPDSLTYSDQSDSVGSYSLTAIPRGTYVLFATIDQNRNAMRDRREAFDSATVLLDSTLSQVLWTVVRDSVGPRITTALIDSVTVRVSFTQKLSPELQDSTNVTVFTLPDTVPVNVAHVWPPQVYDSVRTVEATAAGTPDTAEAAMAPDSLPVPARPTPPPIAQADTVPAADTTAVQRLLATRPTLIDQLIVRTSAPLAPGSRLLIVVRAANVIGAFAESQSVLVIPAVSDSS